MSAGPPRSTLLKRRLDRFARVLRGAEKGDVRSLHRVRVASRRLRELVPVLQLDPEVTSKLGRRLRKVTTRLGNVRELDVLLLLIGEWSLSHPAHGGALRTVGAAVEKAGEDARKRLVDDLPPNELWRLARKLDHVLDGLRRAERDRPEHHAPGRSKTTAWAIDARVANRAARLTAAVHAAGAVYLPERLHDVRITVKKLRYAFELVPPERDKSGSALRTLKRVQGILGRMHDLQVLIERVRDVQASLTPPSLAVWRELDALVVALDEGCRRLHARYVHERHGIEAIANRLCGPGASARHAARQVG